MTSIVLSSVVAEQETIQSGRKTGFASRARNSILGAVAIFMVPLAAAADCIPDPFPVDWLEQQEDLGGHTLSLHTNLSDQFLLDRLFYDQLNATSTYPNEQSADQDITGALSLDRDVINDWADQAYDGDTVSYDYTASDSVGIVAVWPPNFNNIFSTNKFRVVLRADGYGNCLLLTSYPQL